ncbi:hypothetical protein C8J57DRAFT_1711513 [Mycena rebaudengoi]|nr:hypothetical protein C8J57DRAFT_1711513 [Mycena rebaudengoi]
MGSDTPCSLTGGCYYTGSDIVSHCLERTEYQHLDERLVLPSSDIVKRLEYCQEEIEASQDLVLLVPKNEEGEIDIEDYEGPIPTSFTPETIAAVFNFTIGAHPDLSGFCIRNKDDDRDEDEDEEIDVSMYAGYNKHYIFLYAYRILVGRFPELEPHIIYATLADRRFVQDAENCNIVDQYAWYPHVADVQEDQKPVGEEYDNVGDTEYFFIQLLTDESRTEDQRVQEAWLGKGRMYMHCRADRFPSAEPLMSVAPSGNPDTTFTKLSFDILDYLCVTYLTIRDASLLLCLSRTLRHRLAPFIDSFAHKEIARRQPWLLPIQDAECLRGDEEIEKWLEMWDGKLDEIPWCAQSSSSSAMGSDTPCSLTGGCYYTRSDIVSHCLERTEYQHLDERLVLPSSDIVKRLEYCQEEIEASQDLVLLVPRNEDGEIDIEDYAGPIPTSFTPDTIAAVFNFTIGANPDLSGFCIKNKDDDRDEDEDDEEIDVSMYAGYNKHYIFLYAYRILVGRFPELEPHIIYATLADRRFVQDAEDCNIVDQYAWYPHVADVQEDQKPEEYDDVGDIEYFFIRLLTDESRTEDQRVQEAWLGKGRMYMHCRADRFPSAEPLMSVAPSGNPDTTFTKLPFDILDYLCVTYLTIRDASLFLCLSRTLRHTLAPFINSFSHKEIARRQPWLLPIQDAECLRGDEEMEKWLEMWDGKLDEIPWYKGYGESQNGLELKPNY